MFTATSEGQLKQEFEQMSCTSLRNYQLTFCCEMWAIDDDAILFSVELFCLFESLFNCKLQFINAEDRL